MASTGSRTLALLALLEARRYWPGTELADRLGVSPRTLRRDVDRLRELGYPVEAARGIGGGYQLGAGSALPPLVLDDDEAVALVVGLHTAADSMVGGRGGVVGARAGQDAGADAAAAASPCRRAARRDRPGTVAGERRRRSRPRCSTSSRARVATRRGSRSPTPHATARRRERYVEPYRLVVLASALVPARVRRRPRRLAQLPRRPDRRTRARRPVGSSRARCPRIRPRSSAGRSSGCRAPHDVVVDVARRRADVERRIGRWATVDADRGRTRAGSG